MADYKMKKRNLHDALVSSLDDTIAVLSPYIQSKRIPREPITEARHRPEGGYVYHHYHRRSYTDLAMVHSKEWTSLPALKKAQEEFVNDGDVRKDFKIVGFGSLSDYVEEQIINQFIYRALRMTRRWPPKEVLIEALFREYEEYLLGSTVSCNYMVPLQNFESNKKKIVIEQGIEVRQISEREKEALLSRVINGNSLESQMDVMRHKFAAFITLSWDKGITPPDYREKVRKLITTLRLFKAGAVGVSVVYRSESKWQPGHIVGGSGKDIYSIPAVGPIFSLNQLEIKDFIAFWIWLHQQPISNSVEVGLRWFNHGYEDWIVEDKIVSFVTGFESMFLRKGDRKRRNLMSRLPRLLGSVAAINRLETTIKDIWDLRSSYIHAEPYPSNASSQLVELSENFLRHSIKRYIELERKLVPNSHVDILKWLDDPNIYHQKRTVFPKWLAI